jgi:serine/threonine protein phosphatase 1
MRNLAIGDIHGCYHSFKKLLEKVKLSKDDNLYILGDMINRGNYSSMVINYILKKQEKGYNIFPIKGNHEQMFINLINESPALIKKYTKYYKSKDLLKDDGTLKTKCADFISSLPFYLENKNSIFVHAALDLTRKDIFENTDFMLYSRFQRGSEKQLKGKRLFHGHVPTKYEQLKQKIENDEQIIGIDCGCVMGNTRNGYGRLICIDTDTLELFSVKKID